MEAHTYKDSVRFQTKLEEGITAELKFDYSIHEEKESMRVIVNGQVFRMSNTQFLRFFHWMRQLPYDTK